MNQRGQTEGVLGKPRLTERMDGEVQSEFCLNRICGLKEPGMVALRAVKLLFLLIVTLRPNSDTNGRRAKRRLTAALDRHGTNTSYAGASSVGCPMAERSRRLLCIGTMRAETGFR